MVAVCTVHGAPQSNRIVGQFGYSSLEDGDFITSESEQGCNN